MSHPFPYNPGPPYVIGPTVKSADFDLSAVTSATIVVADPNRETTVLAATLGTAVLSGDTWSLTVSHALALGELDVAGPWTGEVRMLTPDGEIVSEQFLFSVRRALGS